MDTISLALNITPLSDESLLNILCEAENIKHSCVVPGAFPGWQKGESKQKMSEARKNNPNKYALASIGGKACAEKRSQDPNYKKQQSEKMKAIWAKRRGGMVYGD